MGTGGFIGHHTLICANDGNAKSATHLRDVVALFINSQPWTADAGNFFNHWATIVVLQLHRNLGLHFLRDRVTLDEALARQYIVLGYLTTAADNILLVE